MHLLRFMLERCSRGLCSMIAVLVFCCCIILASTNYTAVVVDVTCYVSVCMLSNIANMAPATVVGAITTTTTTTTTTSNDDNAIDNRGKRAA